jgi:hypothetical protein
MSYSAVIDICGIMMLELVKIAYWQKLSVKQKIAIVANSNKKREDITYRNSAYAVLPF